MNDADEDWIRADEEFEEKDLLPNSLNPQAFASLLSKAGVRRVAVQSSVVQGSPYDYVYIYLSNKGLEGGYLIVSDAKENGDEGITLGRHDYTADAIAEIAIVFSDAHALLWVLNQHGVLKDGSR
jgi:hypothetical protein